MKLEHPPEPEGAIDSGPKGTPAGWGRPRRRTIVAALVIVVIGGVSILGIPNAKDHIAALVGGAVPGDGSSLYEENCTPCHGEHGGLIASVQLNSAAFLDKFDDAALVQSIRDGKGKMPAQGKGLGGPLSDGEIQSIVAFLRSATAIALPTQTQPANIASSATLQPTYSGPGASIYAQNCASCHGESGDKVLNIDLNSPAFLRQKGDGTLLAVIAKGNGAMPAFAGKLSIDDMKTILSFLHSWANAITPPGGTGRTPPDIPHPIKGREDACWSCHGPKGVKPAPISHGGRTTDMCPRCHTVAATGFSQDVDLPPAGSIPQRKQRGAPLIPHSLVGREGKCPECHGPQGFVPAPHIMVSASKCTECHKKGYVDPTPTPVGPASAESLYLRYCAGCHGEHGDRVASANLASPDFLRSRGDSGLSRIIASGAGGKMPYFGLKFSGPLNDAQIGGIVNHIKSLAGLLPTGGGQ